MERNVDLLKSQFDIDREPFSDAGISGLFYPGAGRQQVLEQLLHLVRYGPPLLLVVGDEGSGKTLLSHQLNRQLDSSIFSCVSIEATVLMDDRALMALICDGFNLHVEIAKDSVVPALVRFAAESESYSQTALVVIDGVQNLSEAAVKFLAEIAGQVKDSGLRFLLLVDTTDIKQEGTLVSLIGLMDSIGQSLQLSPLDTSEVADYLSYRMRTAGLDGVRFSPQQVKQITGESGGVIARVNQFARETLVHQVPVIAKEARQKIMSPWHLIVVAVIAIGISLLMVSNQGKGPIIEDVAEDINRKVDIEEVIDAVGVPEDRVDGLVQPYSERTDVTAASAEQGKLVDLNYTESEDSVENSFAKEVDPQIKASAVDKVSRGFATDKPIVEAAAKMKWDDSIKAVANKAGQAKSLVNKSAPVKAISDRPLLDKPVAEVPSKVNLRENAKKSTNQITKRNKKPKLNSYTLREKWLLSLDPKQYTLQMIGARDEAAVQEFISRYPSLTKVAYYKTLYKGGDWYVVIYGQFATKNEARQAVEQLPKNLIASKPWTRPLASVQKDIRMARL